MLLAECTPKAITHRISILKKKAEGSISNTASTPATPAARRTATNGLATPRATPKAAKAAPKPKALPVSKKRARAEDDEEIEAQSSADEKDEEVQTRRPKNYDDVESGDDAEQAIDRTPVRRSISAALGRYAGMDDSEEEGSDDDDEAEVQPAKRLKVETEI